MSVSLKQIRYFVAAAETGRISQAAIDLNVSQSAVTAAIQQLEATVCARLLERAPNGVTDTMEGSCFLSQGRQILAAVAEAVRNTQMSAGPLFGTIRIGVTYSVSGYFLPRHQTRFQASFPGITIELFEAPRDVLERAIVDGALDLAVMLVSNLRDNAKLTSETLLRSPRRLWLAPEHPLTRAERVHLADIATYDEKDATATEGEKEASAPDAEKETPAAEDMKEAPAPDAEKKAPAAEPKTEAPAPEPTKDGAAKDAPQL